MIPLDALGHSWGVAQGADPLRLLRRVPAAAGDGRGPGHVLGLHVLRPTAAAAVGHLPAAEPPGDLGFFQQPCLETLLLFCLRAHWLVDGHRIGSGVPREPAHLPGGFGGEEVRGGLPGEPPAAPAPGVHRSAAAHQGHEEGQREERPGGESKKKAKKTRKQRNKFTKCTAKKALEAFCFSFRSRKTPQPSPQVILTDHDPFVLRCCIHCIALVSLEHNLPSFQRFVDLGPRNIPPCPKAKEHTTSPACLPRDCCESRVLRGFPPKNVNTCRHRGP